MEQTTSRRYILPCLSLNLILPPCASSLAAANLVLVRSMDVPVTEEEESQQRLGLRASLEAA